MLSQNNSGPAQPPYPDLKTRNFVISWLILVLVFLLLVRGISHELIWDVYLKDALGACGLWGLPNRFDEKIPHMTRKLSFGTSLQKKKRIVKLKTKRCNLNHFSMFEFGRQLTLAQTNMKLNRRRETSRAVGQLYFTRCKWSVLLWWCRVFSERYWDIFGQHEFWQNPTTFLPWNIWI